MIKKIITIAIIVLLGAVCVTAGLLFLGNKRADDAAAVSQPGVTITDGRVLAATDTGGIIEGKITKLTNKKISLSVQGVDWDLALTEEVHNNIKRMNELGIEVKVGTLVTIQYTLQDEIRTVEQISRLEAN